MGRLTRLLLVLGLLTVLVGCTGSGAVSDTETVGSETEEVQAVDAKDAQGAFSDPEWAEQNLVGTWDQGGDWRVEFFADGTVRQSGEGINRDGEWTVSSRYDNPFLEATFTDMDYGEEEVWAAWIVWWDEDTWASAHQFETIEDVRKANPAEVPDAFFRR